MHVGGQHAAAVEIDRVAVGLGAREGFGRDVALRAGLVLDQHDTAGRHPQLLRVITHDDVRARAGRRAADHMNVLAWVLLRKRWASRCQTSNRRGSDNDIPARDVWHSLIPAVRSWRCEHSRPNP